MDIDKVSDAPWSRGKWHGDGGWLAAEVWSTGGERMGIRDGAAAVVIEPTRWHAAMSARTPCGGGGCASEAEALLHLRGKLVDVIAAIDARMVAGGHALPQPDAALESFLSRVIARTKHGPGQTGQRGPCDVGCLKCDAMALLEAMQAGAR